MVAVSVTVLSGKGGTAKTLWQMMLAGEASRAGISALLVDADPERNLSNHFGVSQHSTGLGSVLEDADISFWGNPDKGAKRIDEEIIQTRWSGTDLLPAGASLGRVAGVRLSRVSWKLRWRSPARFLPCGRCRASAKTHQLKKGNHHEEE